MEGYSVRIVNASKRLTQKERVAIKDTSECFKLDEACEGNAVIINPDYYVVLDIHNEKSDNKDYNNYIIVDKDGTKYVTGSDSFFTSFKSIMDEMADAEADMEEGEELEEWSIKVYKMDSKNYKGKQFITCSIV